MVVIPSEFRLTRISRALFGKTPVVAFDRPVPDQTLDVVMVQNTAGARRIVEHLIEHGHKRIAYMGLSRSLFTINARFLGYRLSLIHIFEVRLPDPGGCSGPRQPVGSADADRDRRDHAARERC